MGVGQAVGANVVCSGRIEYFRTGPADREDRRRPWPRTKD